MSSPSTSLSSLRVAATGAGRRVVNADGEPVWLRGIAIGGWMNMENFINGYPGVEHSLRRHMADALGPEKATYFFDRLLDHYLTQEDIAFIAGLGANVVRLALNYRHFEDDERPFEYRQEGFRRLEEALGWCETHGLYAILDLHAVQGWQNPDWHSDNRTKYAMLWDHPHFQDRFVALWEELARRYRGRAVIAGYDLMNEPQTRDVTGPQRWDRINALYRRAVDAIRRIDGEHIIFLEGDAFSSRFAGLEAPFDDNVVYSFHDYSLATFGPGAYPGTIRGRYRDRAHALQTVQNLQPVQYAREYGVPLWVGEFGAIYNGPRREIPDRLRALDDQIAAFEECDIHWTIWTYKDVGVMGVVTLDPHSPYMEIVKPILETKLKLASDAWMSWLPSREVHRRVRSLTTFLQATVADETFNTDEATSMISDMVLAGYMATLLQPLYISAFAGMSERELDDVLQSFTLCRCKPNEGLIRVLKQHMA
ncbi:MAG TPA: glycoside hydrolase family 5 protein [Chloroflexota bacterium]